MQQHKSTNKFSEIEVFANNTEELTSSLSEVIGKGKFKLKNNYLPRQLFCNYHIDKNKQLNEKS